MANLNLKSFQCKVGGVNCKIKFTIVSIFVLIALLTAQKAAAQDGSSNVNFPPSDTEAKNYTVSKDDNGDFDLTYNGNRRVMDLNAVRFIDLGIIIDGKRIKWATTNIGAKNPWDYGDYYAWGETKTKTAYYENLSNYSFYENGNFTKYNQTDNIQTLQSDDDIAAITFGNNCAIPTPDEWAALFNNCEWKWINGYEGKNVNGYAVFTKKVGGTYSIDTDPHIFLPAGGSYKDATLNSKGSDGWYWSSSLYSTTQWKTASELHINSTSITPNEESRRFYGLSVRPVMRKNAYINLDKREASVFPGRQITLTATTDPAGEAVVWKSDDETIATVKDGVVTGVKAGETTAITATYNGQTATCIVSVLIPPEKITLSGASYADPYIWGSENVTSKKFTATVTPANAADKSITWSSSHPDIITVDQKGNVKIIAPNETNGKLKVTITATSNYDKNIKASYSINLDNYVDLGTGEVYWKTTNESGTYTFSENATDRPSTFDFNRMINKCSYSVDDGIATLKSKNKSGAYIRMPVGFYWANTGDYTWEIQTNRHLSNPASGQGYSASTNSMSRDNVGDRNALRCVKRYGTIKVGRIIVWDESSSDYYVWGEHSSTITPYNLKIDPSYATNKEVTWTASDGIVKVADDGTITVVAPCENDDDKPCPITITATAKDGSGVNGSLTFNICQYVNLGTGVRWRTTNNTKDGKSLFTYSEAIEAFGEYAYNKKWDRYLPSWDDYKKLLDTDKFSWSYTSTTYTVKNKETGVYIHFPIISCSEDSKWAAYWSSTGYLLNWHMGLELINRYGNQNPPIGGHLTNTNHFPVRLILSEN